MHRNAQRLATPGHHLATPGNIIVIAGFSHLLRRSCDKENSFQKSAEWK